jgi:hypothetical protein
MRVAIRIQDSDATAIVAMERSVFAYGASDKPAGLFRERAGSTGNARETLNRLGDP